MILAAALAFGILFGAGIHLLLRGDVVKLAAGALCLSNAAVLLLLSGDLRAARAPLVAAGHPGDVADPLVQALALTAVVIGFGSSVLLLRIGLEVERSHDSIEMEDLVAAETAEGEDEPAARRAEVPE